MVIGYGNNRNGRKISGHEIKRERKLEQPRFIEKKQLREDARVLEEEREIISVNDFLGRDLKLTPKYKTESKSIDTEKSNSDKNSRCVSVDTNSPTPDGRRGKNKSFKGKAQLVKFRCTTYEKKLLTAKAKLCGLSLSEFLRRTAMEQITVERLTDEEIELYKMLVKYHNNFKSIGNMFKGKNDNLTKMVYETAKEIKEHLKKFSK